MPRSCVNPDHHFIGTRKDNMIDCANKGRTTRGEKNAMAKLKEVQIPTIRKLLETMSQSAVARMHHVHPMTIHQIKAGETWKHVV